MSGYKHVFHGLDERKKNAKHLASKMKYYGMLKMQPCIICGDPNTAMHHEDYDKPMDITWLCKDHHIALHAGRGDLLMSCHKPFRRYYTINHLRNDVAVTTAVLAVTMFCNHKEAA